MAFHHISNVPKLLTYTLILGLVIFWFCSVRNAIVLSSTYTRTHCWEKKNGEKKVPLAFSDYLELDKIFVKAWNGEKSKHEKLSMRLHLFTGVHSLDIMLLFCNYLNVSTVLHDFMTDIKVQCIFQWTYSTWKSTSGWIIDTSVLLQWY